ncbi:MAG: ACP S-malonyltransferase [Anaerolineales bacterium]|nr:ACP S-malonyltransferase [Anaerolineales bacterium]
MSIAYLFPGQGSQVVGMGQTLYTQFASVRTLYDTADDLLGFPLSTLCFTGPEEALTDTVNQQPALFVTSLAMLTAVREVGWPEPAFVAGHSLGELAAVVAAGCASFTDGLQLVRRRGELMKLAGERSAGRMAAVLGAEALLVAEICAQATAETGQLVQIANDNCPGQIVISGAIAALVRATTLLEEQASVRKVVPLPITIAAHSPLMASVEAEYATAVASTPLTDPQIPLVGNTTAEILTTATAVRSELNAQLTGSVRWTESMHTLTHHGITEIVEIGPGDVLAKLMKRIDRQVTRRTFDTAFQISARA